MMKQGYSNLPTPRLCVYGSYLVTFLLSCVILLRLCRGVIPLTTPLTYWGDAVDTIAYIKMLSRHDYNSLCYAPFSFVNPFFWLNLFCGSIYEFLVQVIGFLTDNDSIATINLYFLLTFPLAALSSCFLMLQCRVLPALAVAFSLLYAFIPFHFIRGVVHLQYSSYYLVPLLTLILLWIWSDDHIFFRSDKTGWRCFFSSRKAWFSFFVVVVCGPVTYYFAFFFIVLALGAGFSATLQRRNLRPLISVGILIFFTAVSLYKWQIPEKLDTLIYPEHKINYENVRSEIGISHYGQQELYGLKIVQLLLPVEGHRISFLSKFPELYKLKHIVNETKAAALGVVGALGFLALLAILFTSKCRLKYANELARLNLIAILLATVGGFSSVFALLGYHFFGESFPLVQARGYNRISIFIAIFALTFLGLLLSRFLEKRLPGKNWQISLVLASVILYAGLYDQIPPRLVRIFRVDPKVQESFASDQQFFQDLESKLPRKSRIFQLPFVLHHHEWPASMGRYSEALKPYIHTSSMAITFGGDKGSLQTQWYRESAALAPKALVAKLIKWEFSGILIDCAGYPDKGAALKASLGSILPLPAQSSSDQRYLFFPLGQALRIIKGSDNS